MTQSDITTFAPVTLYQVASRTDRLIGYATPKAGLRPSAVRLMADTEMICAAKATRYSKDAAEAGVRYGWCGFELTGLARALAISSQCSIVCAASGALLERLVLTPEIFNERPEARQALTAAEVFDVAASERCRDVSWILPFAIDHRNRRGPQSFLEATWQMVLDQLPDPESRELWGEIVETDTGLRSFLMDFVAREDPEGGAFRKFPGPFHPSFRYDRTLLS